MKTSAPNIAIVILAAGASSRMGRPKQLLKWGNDNLLNHTINTALKTNASEVIVVLGANHDLIKNQIVHQSITILNNKDWKLGLGKSIACATEYVLKVKPETQGILIVLADQPLINSDFLNEIIEGFSTGQNQIIATAYNHDRKGVPALFDKFYFYELTTLSDDFGAKQLLKLHESSTIILNPPVENQDIDTLDDYNDLCSNKRFS